MSLVCPQTVEDLYYIEKVEPKDMVLGNPYIIADCDTKDNLIIDNNTHYGTGIFLDSTDTRCIFRNFGHGFRSKSYYPIATVYFYTHNECKYNMAKAKERTNLIRGELISRILA